MIHQGNWYSIKSNGDAAILILKAIWVTAFSMQIIRRCYNISIYEHDNDENTI